MTPTLPTSSHVLIGQSPRIKHVVRLVEKLGPCRWPVLLLGETGTGKEVVARSIHAMHPVGPFVTIDCSSLVGPLMESELFGHVKGSFTGAVGTKQGLIESAHGGTAFFDEMGELPLDLQSKLLRVLQEKEFRPVGGLTARKSDFRIIAATNRDLAQEVEKGRFRRDLYYRLNVVTLRLAPLRERREDIAALIDHFLLRYSQGHQLTPEVHEALLSYDWPGNVRELENCIQHLVAVNSGPYLHSADLPSSIMHHQQNTRPLRALAAAAAGGEGDGRVSLSMAGPSPLTEAASPQLISSASPASATRSVVPLYDVEREAILNALRFTKGDRGVAAELLGIGRTTLYRKLKEYEAVS